MEDRLTRGFVAGLIGGIAMNLTNLISVYIFRFAKCLYLDWAAAMLYGHKANNLTEGIVALIAQVFFTGFMSSCFACLIPAVTSRNFWIKGWSFGILAWFFIYAVFILFKVPEFGYRPVESVISNFITASVYGIVQAGALLYFEKRIPND